jgi:septal ring factor EnvC (AmiA/AmiB activator)
MPDEPAPRRRAADRERRRWSDQALDLLSDRVQSHAEDLEDLRSELRAGSRLPGEFAAFRREFDEWKSERRDDVTELRTDIRELRQEQREAHRRLAHHKDPDNGAPLPKPVVAVAATRWDRAKDMATIVSLLLLPILAAYVASGHP